MTPYVPVPETDGEEWDRLEPASALDVLVELALHGEYSGQVMAKRTKDTLELRTTAVNVFEVLRTFCFVGCTLMPLFFRTLCAKKS